MNSHNLAIKALNSDARRSMAKIVRYRGDWVLHAWVYDNYQKMDIEAYGIRWPILVYAREHGVKDIYLYNADRKQTYHSTCAKVLAQGSPGHRDEYGDTLNLRLSEWVWAGDVHVEFVPNERTVVIPQPDSTMPGIEAPKPPPPMQQTLI